MSRATDLVLLDTEELDQRLGDSRRELFNLRFQLATGQLDNPARVGVVRREVARLLTVLRERDILVAVGIYVAASEEDHLAARARIAAEDEAAEAAAAARGADEAEGEDESEAEGADDLAEGEYDLVADDELEPGDDDIDEAGDAGEEEA